MNCCDDNGRCTCSTGTPRATEPQGNCDLLGLCQGHEPRCVGCTTPHEHTARGAFGHPSGTTALNLAPGMVEGYKIPVFGTAAQRRELRRWMIGALAWGAVSVVAGLGVGLLVGLFSGVVR